MFAFENVSRKKRCFLSPSSLAGSWRRLLVLHLQHTASSILTYLLPLVFVSASTPASGGRGDGVRTGLVQSAQAHVEVRSASGCSSCSSSRAGSVQSLLRQAQSAVTLYGRLDAGERHPVL